MSEFEIHPNGASVMREFEIHLNGRHLKASDFCLLDDNTLVEVVVTHLDAELRPVKFLRITIE